jgi:glycosyltransferase involved in cell wall biosynthesis
MVQPRFKIIIPTRNTARWLPKCLESLACQTYRNFDVCIVDDASSDPKNVEIVTRFCEREGWGSILHTERTYLISTMLEGIAALQCADEDVVIQLDGDDWLYDETVLERVAQVYDTTGCWLTYGTQVSYLEGKKQPLDAFPQKRIRRNDYRSHFRFFHLRTFKHLLWKHLRDRDLRDDDGNYFRVSSDVAVYPAMAEMAGSRICHIPDPLYVYNDSNPNNNFRERAEEQQRNAALIRSRPPYPRLKNGKLPEKEGLYSRLCRKFHL